MATIVMEGNIGDGFTAIGPFADFDQGALYAERSCKQENWVMTLEDPAIYAGEGHHQKPEADMAQVQVDVEEVISESIFDMVRAINASNVDNIEENCNQLGRDILQRLVHELTIHEFIALQSLIEPPDSIKV